jgi:hypothetical protein
LNPKWSPKYKNPPIWKKFDFQVDYDVANWYKSLIRSPQTTPISEFGHVDANFIITNQFLTSKYS